MNKDKILNRRMEVKEAFSKYNKEIEDLIDENNKLESDIDFLVSLFEDKDNVCLRSSIWESDSRYKRLDDLLTKHGR